MKNKTTNKIDTITISKRCVSLTSTVISVTYLTFPKIHFEDSKNKQENKNMGMATLQINLLFC